MKLFEFAVLSLTFTLASCSSVAIPTDPQPYSPAHALADALASASAKTTSKEPGADPSSFEAITHELQASQGPRTWDLTILAGYRNMSAGAWSELENQAVLGFEAAFYPAPKSPVGLEVGIQGSYSRDGERSTTGQRFHLDGSVGEIYVGGRNRGRIGSSPIRYASGLGLGLIRADREDVVNGVVERGNDTSLTFYAHLLLAVDLSPGIYFGFDIRADFGSTMTINGNSGSANYWQGALALGFDL